MNSKQVIDPHYGIVDTIEKKDFSNGSWKKVNIDYTPNALGTGTIRYDYIDLGNGIKRNASLTFNYDGKGKVPAFKGASEVFSHLLLENCGQKMP